MEIWKPIKENENYEISNEGNFRSKKKDGSYRMLTISLSGCYRYYMVSFVDHEGPRKEYLHRIMAETFIPNPQNLSVVGFKNLDGHDCRLENLYWTTQAELMARRKAQDKYIKGEYHHKTKMTVATVKEARELYKQGKGTSELARKFGIDPSTMDSIVRNKTWKHIL